MLAVNILSVSLRYTLEFCFPHRMFVNIHGSLHTESPTKVREKRAWYMRTKHSFGIRINS